MDMSEVLLKTRKGLEEIETRAHKLPGRLRAVLIMVDGQRTVGQLLEQAGDLADQLAGQLNDLIKLGFIEGVRSTLPEEDESPAAGRAVEQVEAQSRPAEIPAAGPAVSTAAAVGVSKSGPAWTTIPLEVLKARFTKMLNDSLGMRAMFLTAQLGAVRNHRELEAVVDEMAQSLATTMGADAARKWRAEARGTLGIPG